MSQLKTIIVFTLGGMFAILVLQNTQVVSIRFLTWQVSMSRIILLPMIFCAGVFAGYMLKRARK